MTGCLATRKRSIRKEVLARRRSLSPLERAQKSQIIAHKVGRFLANVHVDSSSRVACGAYLPFPDEVNILNELIAILGEQDLEVHVSLPVYDRDTYALEFFTTRDPEHTSQFLKDVKGADTSIDVRCPLWKETHTRTIRYWLVPGIAFSPSCDRIGFGLGYYDRALSQLQGVFIGLAFDIQICGDFLPEPLDIPMDVVFTEKHTFVRSNSIKTSLTLDGGQNP